MLWQAETLQISTPMVSGCVGNIALAAWHFNLYNKDKGSRWLSRTTHEISDSIYDPESEKLTIDMDGNSVIGLAEAKEPSGSSVASVGGSSISH